VSSPPPGGPPPGAGASGAALSGPGGQRGGVGVWTQLWRGVVAYRVAALVYAVALTLGVRGDFAHPAAALGVIGAMVAWTAVLTAANSRDRGRVWPVVLADHVVCAALTLASIPIQGAGEIASGAPTLTTAWAAAPVLSSALLGGPWGGLAGALVQGAASVVVRGEVTLATLGNVVLLLLAGGVGGYVARLAVAAERRLAEAVRLAAATRERERLARGIHDGVLQVLALVRRRGAELGGAAGELAVLAGEQETALRTLITTAPPLPADPAASPGRPWSRGRARPGPDGAPEVDLRALVGARRSEAVTVSGPAEPVLLPGAVAEELAAAVAAALDNAAVHGGGRAWVLVEDLGTEVAVSVRDEGPGIPAGRLEQAEADGRLGVASSMRGRIAELGGTMSVHTVPGEGTEVEFRVPRGGH
jgi:signal transduction histidine kinase